MNDLRPTHRGFRMVARLVSVAVLTGLLSLAPAAQPAAAGASSTRITGATRAQTSVALARQLVGGNLRQLTHIIVTSDSGVVDPSVSAGLAAFLDSCAPAGSCRTAVFVTPSGSLDPATAAAITESGVAASNVIIVGGAAAMSPEVQTAIARSAGWNGTGEVPTRRIAGANRFETSAAVAEFISDSGEAQPDSFKTVVVVNGDRPADVLLASTLAAGLGHALILTSSGLLPSNTRAAIESLAPNRMIIVGGDVSVPPSMEAAIRALLPANSPVDRLGGADRFETSALIASRVAGSDITSVVIVSGISLEDAVTIGMLTRLGAPVLFTGPASLPPAVANWLSARRLSGASLITVGDESSVPSRVVDSARGVIDGPGSSRSGHSRRCPARSRSASEDFILSVETDGPSQTVGLPLGGDVDVVIDWGDGTTDTATIPDNYSHTYGSTGSYTVTITKGSGPGPYLTEFGDPARGVPENHITAVTSWGDLGLESLSGAFQNSTVIQNVAEPPSSVTDLSQMFMNAASFNQNIRCWDVSNVTTMYSMFSDAESFNQDVGDWDVSNVDYTAGMFMNAVSFNQNLSRWDVGKVTRMYSMFNGATSFNNGCEVDDDSCPLLWDVGEVYSADFMFANAESFNQDISRWDTSRFNQAPNMFAGAVRFNQDLSNWNVGQLLYAHHMFYEATDFNNGCAAGDDSCPLDWNLDANRTAQYMFYGATDFNQDISSWDTSDVTDMTAMFYGATHFNQDLSGWDVRCVADHTDFDTDAIAWIDASKKPDFVLDCPAPG